MYIGPGIVNNDVLTWDAVTGKWYPSGLNGGNPFPVVLQSLLGRNRIHWLESLSGGSGVIVAGAFGLVGVGTSFAADWSTAYKSTTRSALQSSAAAGSSVEAQGTGGSSYALSSTIPAAGGFVFYTRVAAQVKTATDRCFYGMAATGAAIGNVQPSSLLNQVGVQCDLGEANLSIGSNDGAGAATRTTLGASFPASTTAADEYEVIIWAAPGQTAAVSWQCTNLITGAQAKGVLIADLPTGNTQLFPRIQRNNGTTAAAITMAYFSVFCQADN